MSSLKNEKMFKIGMIKNKTLIFNFMSATLKSFFNYLI